MELKEIVNLYRRWIWLLVLGLILGLAGGYGASRMQKPVYWTAAKVLIARSRQQSAADPLSMSDQQLASTYVELLKTQPFLAKVESELGSRLDPSNIGIQILPNTQIIQIGVRDGDAIQAAAIANALVDVLIEQNETLQAGRYTTYEQGLNSQITQVQEQIGTFQSQITQINQENIQEQLGSVDQQIKDLQDQISTLEKDISSNPKTLTETDRAVLADKTAQLEQLRTQLSIYQQIQTNLTFIGKPVAGSSGQEDLRITGLQSTLNLYQQLYVNLLNSLETAKLAHAQSTPTVTLIEPATIPETPVSPKTVRNVALSGMLGVLLTAGLVLLMDYFDDTVKTSRKVEEVLHAPVIGQIMDGKQKQKWYEKANKTNFRDVQLDNAFGDLRINLSRLMANRSQKRIFVTSTARSEGKTTVAANLAEAFLQAGKKVILVDADLYRPQLHKRLRLQNEIGLTDILSGGIEWESAAIKVRGLTIITAGATPSSLSGLLESHDMSTLLDKMQKKADVVIVDGPPLFVVDAQVMASKVGGVLLVIRQGETTIGAARSVARKLELLEIHLYGVVLNGAPRGEAYNYYGDYYKGISDEKPPSRVNKQVDAGVLLSQIEGQEGEDGSKAEDDKQKHQEKPLSRVKKQRRRAKLQLQVKEREEGEMPFVPVEQQAKRETVQTQIQTHLEQEGPQPQIGAQVDTEEVVISQT
jgi:capsular exopolysaccharide synthesis family protein